MEIVKQLQNHINLETDIEKIFNLQQVLLVTMQYANNTKLSSACETI